MKKLLFPLLIVSAIIVSCITPQTKQDIKDTQQEIKTTQAQPASPDKDALLATLQARLQALEAKAVQERADSTKAILSDTTVALEGLSPFANMAVPGGGLVVAGLVAFLRRFI